MSDELKRLRELYTASPAPVIDIAGRVTETIHALPKHVVGSSSMMAICAAVCAIAASLALIASFAAPQPQMEASATTMFIESYDIDVNNLIPK